ncbi:hypothetical protein KC678_04915 [Candidatus Dojkabacteria bacterium]|uniref:Sporulation stage II protein D amidase enhancer LytB N-terminal domain-containing protein n=1 Tax=Candidatus Dojkabacteria bacterium TaxID=2099670 RepID=A0A955RGQ8_9BACT|nr:hypothetical protein [Candidatus Dojkabacteria bacterium]
MIKKGKKLLLLSIIAVYTMTAFLPFVTTQVHSQSSAELLEQIKQKEQELKETEDAIANLEEELSKTQDTISTVSEGLPKLEAEIKEVETQLEINQKKRELTQQQFDLKQKERQQLIQDQQDSVETLYVKWRVENSNISFFDDDKTKLLATGLSQTVFGVSNENLAGLNGLIESLDSDIASQDEVLAELDSQNSELNEKKAKLDQELSYYAGVLASSTTQISQLQDRQSQIKSQISDLTIEQQAAAEREAWILQQELAKQRAAEDVDIVDGFYFAGQGRDVYQGHGVGFSQFGAYGGANAGMSYQQLIQFYFSGINLEKRSGNVSVYGGPQNIDVEEYLVHLGEVPDKACGTLEQAKKEPDKYIVNESGSVWSCWPEEAIKAQVVIARTYALYHTNLYSDARSQVYSSTYNKAWAVEETSGVVITYGGDLIDAVYSSDNSQGNGTANNDTIFQNFFGDGTPHPYLRAVNDSSFAYKTQWTNWSYQTNVYNNESIESMLNHIANTSSSYDDSVKSKVRDIINTVGSIESLSFERDPSQRVKKVYFNGSNGQQAVMGGWWFKNLWNTWAYETGRNDYLYSQTFFTISTN